MRFIRRLPDLRSRTFFVVASLLATGAVASCSSDGDESPPELDASAPDAPLRDAAVDGDASPADAAPERVSPLPIVCGTEPCATSLVTTTGNATTDPAEGFCALLKDGTVACWGANQSGQLGRGEEAGEEDSAMPARVSGLTDVVSLSHTCAVDKVGAVYCWGTGKYLRDGLPATTTERTPVALPIPPATRAAVGRDVGCALTTEGVLCWGANSNAQIDPVNIQWNSLPLGPTKVAIPAGAPFRDLLVGVATFVLREDGALVTWGGNPPLGRASSLFPDPNPLPIAVASVTSVDLAFDNACATGGGVGYCWGAMIPKAADPRGKPPTINRALPDPIVTPEPIVQIATTRNVVTTNLGDPITQPQRWCAVSASGAVFCWGYNASGQAGDGTKSYAFKAVRVLGLSAPAAEVRTTPNATCALLTNGKVACWGANFYGQLGTGRLKVPSLVPQEVILP